MIYTVTCNPAVDYTVRLPFFSEDTIHRPSQTALSYGGKGVNVSRILTALGIENRALGFVAGDVGSMLENGLKRLGLTTDFLHLSAGQTRINVKIAADTETELNAVGPAVNAAELDALTDKITALCDGDTLCLCGSLPPGCPVDTYARLLQCVADKDVVTVVDATGEVLKNTLPYRPFLIKPNRDELSELVEKTLADDDAVIRAARSLQTGGARNVLVSLGGDGALLLTENGDVYRRAAYHGKVVSTVGAGDSMVAGFLTATARGYTPQDTLRLAVAAGSATAFSHGLAARETIESLLANV